MGETPRLYGVVDTNMSPEGLWSRELFPKTFSVALCNRLRDAGRCVNYVVSGTGQGCDIRCIDVDTVYGTGAPSTELRFEFDTVHVPSLDLASGVPESDLIVRGSDGGCLRRMDMQASVIPDASTRGLASELMGPEMTVRTPTLKNLALTMASSLMAHRDDALAILEKGMPQDADVSDWDSVSDRMEDVVCSLDLLESRYRKCQTPFLMQSLWKSEDGGPLMADDAMDVFVWSDFAFSRLFLDSTRRSSSGATRPARCAVRLHRMLSSILTCEHPDLDRIVASTQYGLPSGNREFMVNGRTTNRYMACERLSKPVFAASDVQTLASKGFESMIVPERRLDSSVYFAVRASRG